VLHTIDQWANFPLVIFPMLQNVLMTGRFLALFGTIRKIG